MPLDYKYHENDKADKNSTDLALPQGGTTD